MNTQRRIIKRNRAGFTILELLIVIVIISALAGLVLVGVFPAIQRARAMEVKAEITRLETAITAFKNEYGVEPWSSFCLAESAAAWTAGQQSKTRLRRIWPDYNFGGFGDLNGDGDTNDCIWLTSSECLVFLLGGVASGKTLTGFSKNPQNPFSLSGENRTTSFYEFDVARLVDTDGDGFWEYLDTLDGQNTPLLYASSNNGQGYEDLAGAPVYYLQSDGTTPWKNNSHQLISPGADGDFGFDPQRNPDMSPPVYTGSTSAMVAAQRDNVTNFITGTTLGE